MTVARVSALGRRRQEDQEFRSVGKKMDRTLGGSKRGSLIF